MSTEAIVSIVALIGWLIIAGSALASFRLGWSKIVQMALIWFAIFAGLVVVVQFLGLSL